jgi:hypothetical protein
MSTTIEVNFEALSALSISDIIALRDYYNRQSDRFYDKSDTDCYDILTEEFQKRINNIFTL